MEPCKLRIEESTSDKILCIHYYYNFQNIIPRDASNNFCFLFLRFSLDDVEGLESLRWEDQQKIIKYVEGGGPSNKIAVSAMEYGIEVSQSSRATCKDCNQKIMKGEVFYFSLLNDNSSIPIGGIIVL